MGETIPSPLDDYTTLPGKSGATHSISLCIANRFTVTGPGSGHSGLTLLVVRTGISQARACALWVLRSCSAAESPKFKELFTLAAVTVIIQVSFI